MAKFGVSFQTETILDTSPFLPVSTVSDAPGFGNLLNEKPAIAIVYLVLLCFVTVWGGTTNFIVLIVHAKNKKLNKAGRIFLVNLALADLCVNLVAVPFCIIGVTHGEKYFQEHPHLCRFIGSFCFSACVCAILNLTMATINRYMYVCHNQICKRYFNGRISVGIAILIWVTALLIDTSNVLGWGGYIYDRKNHSCIWDRMASFSFTMFVSVVLIVTPIVTIALLNVLLMRRIHATKFNICRMRDIASMKTTRDAWIETLRSSRTLFTMCVVFCICWIPYAAIVAFDTDDTYPEEVHLFITLLAHSHSAMNFILYWVCNKEFPKTVYGVFGGVLPCGRSLAKPLPSCSTSSLSELASPSSSAEGNDSQKRSCCLCCQCTNMFHRNSGRRNTSVEIIRTDTNKEVGSDSFKGDYCEIYTIRYSISGTPNVPDFQSEATNSVQNMKETRSAGSGDNVFIRGEISETHGGEAGVFNRLTKGLNKKSAKYNISK